MFCHICLTNIPLSKTKEHVRSHCLDNCTREEYLRVYRKVSGVVTFKGSFRPSKERLEDIAKKGSELLANATPEDLEDWTEWD